MGKACPNCLAGGTEVSLVNDSCQACGYHEREWEAPAGLSEDGLRARKTLMAFLANKGLLSSGGCKVPYSPAEWAARGEDYGRTAELIVVYDGGSHRAALTLDEECYSLNDELQEALVAAGLFMEECTTWYGAIYKHQPHASAAAPTPLSEIRPAGPKNVEGLPVQIYSAKENPDYSQGGLSARHGRAVLVWEGMPEDCKVARSDGGPVIKVVERRGYKHAEPLDQPGDRVGPMMGGTFVYSNDGRFQQHVSAYPIPLHDRFETPEESEALSR